MCQRYYYNLGNTPTYGASGYHMIAWGFARSGINYIQSWTKNPVTMRATPSITYTGTKIYWQSGGISASNATASVSLNSNASSTDYLWVDFSSVSSLPATDGITTFVGGPQNESGYLQVSAEL